jgi:hypothetical protein
MHASMYFSKLEILEQNLVYARGYRNIKQNKTWIRRTKTAGDEMLQDDLYSTLDGDLNISTM